MTAAAPLPGYATFWQRLCASFVDLVVLWPGFWLLDQLGTRSRELAIFAVVLQQFLFVAYFIYGHGRFGRTVGKHLMKIRVARLDGSRLGWSEAWKRSSVDIGFALIYCFGEIQSIMALSPEAFAKLADSPGFLSGTEQRPMWLTWFDWVSFAWVWSEVVVMLMNEQRRAVHDYIAGTIVISNRRNVETG